MLEPQSHRTKLLIRQCQFTFIGRRHFMTQPGTDFLLCPIRFLYLQLGRMLAGKLSLICSGTHEKTKQKPKTESSETTEETPGEQRNQDGLRNCTWAQLSYWLGVEEASRRSVTACTPPLADKNIHVVKKHRHFDIHHPAQQISSPASPSAHSQSSDFLHQRCCESPAASSAHLTVRVRVYVDIEFIFNNTWERNLTLQMRRLPRWDVRPDRAMENVPAWSITN